MDEIYHLPCSSSSSSSASATATSSVGGTKYDGSDYLRHLNKLSHKISKPPLKKSPLDQPLNDDTLPPHHNPHQHQPPVYNINKNDFRDVVQKLTGSPAHDRAPAPAPPPPPPKLPSSRLHRIRPPPLSHLSPRPPPQLYFPPSAPLLDTPSIVASLNPNPNLAFFPGNFNFTFGRPSSVLSPLPPLPSAHGAAESPVSAYMRRINTSSIPPSMDSKGDPFLSFRPSLSPRWSNLAPPPFPGQAPLRPPEGASSSQHQLLPVPAPMPFACSSSSPKSPYGLISPGFLFSQTSPGFPLSPSAVPVPSPRSGGA